MPPQIIAMSKHKDWCASKELTDFLTRAISGCYCEPVTFLPVSDELTKLYALGINKYETADGETVIGYYNVIVDWTGCEINTAPVRLFQTPNALFTLNTNCCTSDSSFHETGAVISPEKRVMYVLDCMRTPQDVASGYKVLNATFEDILTYARRTLEYNYTHDRKIMFDLRVQQCINNLARATRKDQDSANVIMNDNIGLDLAIKLQHARWLMPVTVDMKAVLESVVTTKPRFEKLFISPEEAATMTAPRSFKEATVTFDVTTALSKAVADMAVDSSSNASTAIMPSLDDFGDFGDFGDMPAVNVVLPDTLPIQFAAVGDGVYRPPKRANNQSDVLFNAGPAPADIVRHVLTYGESIGDYYVSECCALLYLEIKKYGPIPK
jgi:hypothetical protein